MCQTRDPESRMVAIPLSRSSKQASFAELEARSLGAVRFELEVTDPDVIAELLRHPAGEERNRFAAAALRLGVLSLRMASGQVDGAAVAAAGDRLVSEVRELLSTRASEMTREMATALSQYFDPQSGLVTRRLQTLVQKDGELERVLASHVGGDESAMARTLSGQLEPLFRMLSPTQADGLRAQLEKTVEHALVDQRGQILREFSLDNKDSALRRLVDELDTRHSALRTDLKDRVADVVKEFSLDQPNSALSRLVSRVEQAQTTITSEFSLDREDSALSRMSRQFQELRGEMLERLAALTAQREEAGRSTRHGVAFEDQLGEVLARCAAPRGDICERTGNSTGAIKNCKVGDYVIELGPESPAAGARIAWEAKEDKSYDVRAALDEIERARKNRTAQVGVFVFSARSAPDGVEPLSRYGDDLLVVWDAASPITDIYVKAAYSAARALAVRVRETATHTDEAIVDIERATRTVEKQVRFLEDIRKSAETTISSGEKIRDRAVRMQVELEREIETIDRQLAALRIDG
jgi:uncharacterized protein (DUF2267 family)